MKRRKQLKQAQIEPWNGSPIPELTQKAYFPNPFQDKIQQNLQKYKKYNRMLNYQSQKAKQIQGLTNFIQKNKKLISDQYLFPDLQSERLLQNKSNLIFQNKYLIKQFDNKSFTPIKKKHQEIKQLYRRQLSLSTTILSYIDIQKKRKTNLSILSKKRRSFSAKNSRQKSSQKEEQKSQKQRFNRLMKLKNKNMLKKEKTNFGNEYSLNQKNQIKSVQKTNKKMVSERIHSFKFIKAISLQKQHSGLKNHSNIKSQKHKSDQCTAQQCNQFNLQKKSQTFKLNSSYYKQKISNFLIKGSCIKKHN